MPMDILTAAYGATVAIGGIIGFAKAGSTPSLAMGMACGGLLIYGAYEMGRNPSNVTIPLVTSAVLTGVMGYRFSKTGKLMPAGLVAALSLMTALRLTYKVMSEKKMN